MLSDDFLDTARRLAAGTTQGDWRSAISRAYYACFHYFCTLSERLMVVPPIRERERG